MSVARIANFNWDRVLSKIECAETKKAVNILRGKANDIAGNATKFVKPAAPLDFDGYKKKLRFTASAVDVLEKAYKDRKLPKYTAAIPAFEAKKRELMKNVAKSAVAAAEADIASMNKQLELFEKIRITDQTSVAELRDRFPQIARDIENEINSHDWVKDSK